MNAIFIEAKPFARKWPQYLSEDELRELQNHLLENPDSGVIIRNTGGIRKLRWRVKERGKRGGLRIIYFWHVRDKHIYLLTIYRKNELEDLTREEFELLRRAVERW